MDLLKMPKCEAATKSLSFQNPMEMEGIFRRRLVPTVFINAILKVVLSPTAQKNPFDSQAKCESSFEMRAMCTFEAASSLH
jgi:hypothetical protein